jgi:hypothetical protein
MTGISLHMQWPLTSQLHGNVSQRAILITPFQGALQKLNQVFEKLFFSSKHNANVYIDLKTLSPSGIRTRDLLS